MLAVAVLAAQLFASVHQADLAAHASEQVCHVCVSLGGLGAANVGFAITLSVPRSACDVPEHAGASRPFEIVVHFFARGPPVAS